MKILESYKKMAKSLLTEHAWDRKFGEPLPTIQDVIWDNMNEEDKNIHLKKIRIEAEPGQGGGDHKEGDVWQTASGWAAWRPGDDTAEYGIEDKENAVKWAKGKIDPDSTSGSDDDEKEPATKLGGGDFDRDGGEPEDKPFGGDTGADADSGGGEVDDYGVEAGSMADDEDAKQAVQGALQGQETNMALRHLRDAGYEAMADLIQSDEDFDTKVKSYVHAMGESIETSKKHPLSLMFERINRS